MGLSDDQRAMLRMVAQRGEQGYEDIAALMGLSVDEVRLKVAAALAELDEEGGLESGKAGGPAPEEAPAPRVAAAPEPAPASPPPPRPRRRQPRPRPSLPRGQALWAAIAGGAIIVALIVIALIVGGGSDSSSESTASGTTTTAESGKGSTDPNEVTKAVLRPIGGSKDEGEGVAVFGRVKESLALEIAANGLQPTASGEEYTVWLSKSPQKMLPLASVKAPKGRIAAQLEVPTEVLAYLANETFTELAITLTDDASLEAALKTAVKEKATTPEYTGQEVLRGTISGPIVGAAQRLEEREKEEQEK
jgi:hypothetical protein